MDAFRLRQVPLMARRNYLYEMQHILAWGVLVGFVEGNFAAVVCPTRLRRRLADQHCGDDAVAMHLASLWWGTLAVGRRKLQLFTVCASGVVLATGSIVATPAAPWGAWLFVSQMAAAQFFLSGVVTLRTALWKHNYPTATRGRVTSRVQIVRYVTQSAAVAIAALLSTSTTRSIVGYTWSRRSSARRASC